VDSEEVETFASLCALRDIRRDIKVNGMNREQAFCFGGMASGLAMENWEACLAEMLGFRD
jgi:hypothetical protein